MKLRITDHGRLLEAVRIVPPALHRVSQARRDLQLLASLKTEWKVSMQALLMRATSLGALTKNQTQYLWKQISARRLRLRLTLSIKVHIAGRFDGKESERRSFLIKLKESGVSNEAPESDR
jgi:Zn-dependent peptidase ImmA (M78 family)